MKTTTSLLLSLIACASSLWAADVYVSPSGSDSNPGTLEKPFRTIQQARDMAASNLKANPGQEGAIRIFLRKGIYPQEKTLEFLPKHSGTPQAPIHYIVYENEEVIISGGRKITGEWQKVAGKPYYALQVPGAGEGKWVFNMLYVNGESRTRARTPNVDEKNFRAEGRVSEWKVKEKYSMRFKEGDFNPAWSDPKNIDIVLLMTWTPVHHRVSRVDFKHRGLSLASDGGQHQLNNRKNFRYYLANVFEGLDAPGEWYLNPKTGMLYYYPMPGEQMDDLDVIAPVIKDRLVEFKGDARSKQTVSHLKFQGITFAHTGTNRDKWNGVYRQAHAFLDAAIYGEGVTHTSFSNCTIKNTGEYGMEMARGCQHLTITRCHFWDLGAGGIQLGASKLKQVLEDRKAIGFPADEKEKHARTDALHNTIENCIIHKTGTYWHSGYGINVRFSPFTKILHNTIFDTLYTAIAVDARWEDYQGENYNQDNEIAYNHIHHIGRGFFSDGGAIYQFGPGKNHYHHNHIHDLTSWNGHNDMKGIYYDQQSHNTVAEYNLIYNTSGVGLNQHWGFKNTFRNNLVAFTKGATQGAAHLPENNFAVYRNVFISKDGVGWEKPFARSDTKNTIRDNLFYDVNHDDVRMWFLPMEKWHKQTGYGENTFFADPGCADPANLDFTIQEVNDALTKIGFKNFTSEIQKAGVYGDRAWTQLAKTAAIRPEMPQWTAEELRAGKVNFELDFESEPVGADPGIFFVHEEVEKDAVINVTAEEAANGKQSLVMVDAPDLDKRWLPMLTLEPKTNIDELQHTIAFHVMLDDVSPISLNFECRGKFATKEVGPRITFQENAIRASGKKIADYVPGEWIRVEVGFGKGMQEGHYTVRISDTKGEKAQTFTVPYVDSFFRSIDTMYFFSPTKAAGKIYLDDIRFQIGVL